MLSTPCARSSTTKGHSSYSDLTMNRKTLAPREELCNKGVEGTEPELTGKETEWPQRQAP